MSQQPGLDRSARTVLLPIPFQYQRRNEGRVFWIYTKRYKMAGREYGRVIELLVGTVLKPVGFKKERKTWRRSKSDRIEVLNIQASQWSPLYYINYGVYIKILGTLEKPHDAECHLWSRLSGDLISPALDGEDNSMPQEQKLEVIESKLRTVFLPFLEFDDFRVIADKYDNGDAGFNIRYLTPDEFLLFARSGRVPRRLINANSPNIT